VRQDGYYVLRRGVPREYPPVAGRLRPSFQCCVKACWLARLRKRLSGGKICTWPPHVGGPISHARPLPRPGEVATEALFAPRGRGGVESTAATPATPNPVLLRARFASRHHLSPRSSPMSPPPPHAPIQPASPPFIADEGLALLPHHGTVPPSRGPGARNVHWHATEVILWLRPPSRRRSPYLPPVKPPSSFPSRVGLVAHQQSAHGQSSIRRGTANPGAWMLPGHSSQTA